MESKKKLFVIVGPTAVGKTALSIQLAKAFDTEIVSADSRQFFKEMSIGTAKPNATEMGTIKHHFIDSHSISEEYNVGKFETEAIQVLNTLFETKNYAILVGGSGLYIDAICNGLDELPEASEEIRQQLKLLYEEKGIMALQEQLKELDLNYYNQVDLNNPQRLMRALEVCLSTGKTYSEQRAGKTKARNFTTIKIGLTTSREELYNRINKRVDEMLQQGLLDEVKSLLPYQNKNALQTVGYKELFDYLENKTSLEQAVALIKQHTRNFAKRQLTWFKRDEQIQWFEPNEFEKIKQYITSSIN
ncbi:MAG: tRNA (adenosine(37)-N6)-dimethylallyltransferase MiaA [Bacteroidetes bacterium]|nr:tRNA (adenosine(37)-N6)-dimethylallyltransferase MiaA [Bacteroidota bacterium]